MKQQRDLVEEIWATKPTDVLEGVYRNGSNLRAEAAARWLEGGETLLDLGCGGGIIAELVPNRFREIHGIDLSAGAVAAAQRRGVTAREWDLNKLPLPYEDRGFDAVILLSVIQYVFDPAALLADVARLVRPGGLVIVGFPNMRTVWRLWSMAVLGRMPRVSEDPGYDGGTIHAFCRQNIEEMLVQSGLQVDGRSGLYTRPRMLTSIMLGIPGLSGVVREFFAAEGLVMARRRTS